MEQRYSSNNCYHCDLPIPNNFSKSLEVLGQKRCFCCEGCFAVAEMIVQNQLDDYYKFRTESADKPDADEQLYEELKAFDDKQVQEDFLVHTEADKPTHSILLYAEQIRCSACAWLIERRLSTVKGIRSVQVNVTSQIIHLSWEPQVIALSDVMKSLHHLGYKAMPFKPEETVARQRDIQKSWLKRLGLAGLGMMQVMMFAVALYLGAFRGMAEQYQELIRGVSFLIATPVLFYSGYPFYSSALSVLKNKQLNMDVPITLALFLAYGASIVAVVNRTGEVYFDSVTMFVFFLLIGRFIEFRVRQQVSERIYKGNSQTPNYAEHYDAITQQSKPVATKAIKDGDLLLVRPGKYVVVDGELVSDEAELNVSMLNGEFMPTRLRHGESLLAGSVNNNQPFIMRATIGGQGDYWHKLIQLQESALLDKPKIGLLADRVARYFVAAILLIATGVFSYWFNAGSEDALWITLSVLVVSCPCALSLATPIAMTCGTLAYNKHNILIKGQAFLQASSTITDIVFDKTGTLTKGHLSVSSVETFADIGESEALEIIAGLESQSEHPIAQAFRQYESSLRLATNIHFSPFKGVSGSIDNIQYGFGNNEYVCEKLPDIEPSIQDSDSLWLFNEDTIIARVSLADTLREEAKEACQVLHNKGYCLHLLSGDPSCQVQEVAKELALDHWRNDAKPEDKLKYVKSIQQQGRQILMVGDGVNDAPVMALADASIAMAQAADITRISADCYLLSDNLNDVDFALNKSRQTQSIIKQNLLWALLYNVLMIPVAAMGYIPPYIAAIGMSLSSIVVVLNSLRLKK